VGLPVKALVTGSCGFIGRHFTSYLEKRGWDVTGVDIADGRDARSFFAASDERFDLAVHAAAVVGGRDVIDNSPLSQAGNLELDAALFRWVMRTRPGRVIYLSSSAAYPVMHQQGGAEPLREDLIRPGRPHEPDALYGWMKLTGERLAELARSNGAQVTVVRPFSGYGEDQDLCYPFPSFIQRAARREDPFTIWGSGHQIRDFIHVDDVVAATMAVAEAGDSRPVNLGRGIPVSFRELARLVCDAAGYAPALSVIPAAPSGVTRRVADVTRMSRFYQPRVTLREGIRRALEQAGASWQPGSPEGI
jgi:nucleoside-diphosphate-sugar epimerase